VAGAGRVSGTSHRNAATSECRSTAQLTRDAPASWLSRLIQMPTDTADCILDRADPLVLIVGNRNVEVIFHQHHEFDRVDGIGSEISEHVRIGCELVNPGRVSQISAGSIPHPQQQQIPTIRTRRVRERLRELHAGRLATNRAATRDSFGRPSRNNHAAILPLSLVSDQEHATGMSGMCRWNRVGCVL
jgi:hypothetical protein